MTSRSDDRKRCGTVGLALSWFQPEESRGLGIAARGPAPKAVIRRWHQIVESQDLSALGDLLANEAVFHSPVVHTPQRGRELATMYLTAAMRVFGDRLPYVREIVGERDAVLEFEAELDGIHINGVDLIRWNDAGKIVDFKVMVRPLKAINLLHQTWRRDCKRRNNPAVDFAPKGSILRRRTRIRSARVNSPASVRRP